MRKHQPSQPAGPPRDRSRVIFLMNPTEPASPDGRYFGPLGSHVGKSTISKTTTTRAPAERRAAGPDRERPGRCSG